MLPSTGYFKGILCPFNENGLCERPYCHYRHLDFDESGAILQKLVSAAVLKALQQNDTGAKTSTQLSQDDTAANPTISTIASSTSKATYNPTPIAELNKINSTDTENLEDPNEQRKRHIPVPYTPRKSAGLPIKRSVDINDPKPFIYNPPGPPVQYKPGSTENVQNDTYTPVGTVESKEKYLPGTEKEIQEYTPDTNANQNSPSKLNYVPSSEKSVNKKKLLEYKPAKVATKTEKPVVTYQPTPRALAPCFSSDEEEPETKKRKLSSDLNGLDDLGPEFDILDQILDEEKPNEKTKTNEKEKSKHSSKDTKKNNGEVSKSEKSNKSHHKSNPDKEKSDENHKSKSEKKLSEEHRKSKSEKKSSEESHKSKSDKKSSDENHRKKNSDDNNKSKSEKKTDKSHQSKSEKKSSDETLKTEKNSDKHHKSNSNKKISDENYTCKSDKKDSKENKHEHKKSSLKCSSKDTEKEKKDSKERHSSDNKKRSSRSSNHSPKHYKHSSSKKTEKHSESRSSSSSKSKEKSSKEKHHKKSKEKVRHRSEDKVLDLSDHDTLDMEENGLEAEDYDLSDADEDAIALECKRIFEEYVPTEKLRSPDENIIIENPEDEYVPSKKRVSRTMDKNIKVIPRAPVKPDFKVSAANAMAERLSKVREFHTSKNATNPISYEIKDHSKVELQKVTFSAPNPVPSKIRIAHVPYASTMFNTKKTISPIQGQPEKLQGSTSSTISQTVKKGAVRVAHMPSEKFIDRPGVLEPLASKIPANIRSIYLNMMIDECLKLYLSTHDAYARAQNEELNTSKKCSTVPIYKNSAVLAVTRLRKELLECNGVKKSANDCTSLKPDSSLKAMNFGSWSIESKNRKKCDNPHEFSGTKFYENIQKWVLTEEQLKENCFPRPHESGQKGRAIIYGQNKQSPPKGFIRTCCRCKKEYTVNKKGFPVVKEECVYHPNRKYRVRGEARYQCCTQDGTSDGCCVAPSHVYEYVDFENLKGYVTTMPPDPQVENHGVYSLDCEMCYTTNGLDLTRVTVINPACKVVYETLVKPLHPIIDYNTRYSGITEEQMAQVKTTLLEVQATLLAMFSNKTILVGHSLESDFKALKLIHDTVIDTSVLFPHKMGPPYKRALRNLSTDYLKKIIQNSVEGHDSAEDAMVCMELLQYKLREDLKTR